MRKSIAGPQAWLRGPCGHSRVPLSLLTSLPSLLSPRLRIRRKLLGADADRRAGGTGTHAGGAAGEILAHVAFHGLLRRRFFFLRCIVRCFAGTGTEA